MVLKQYVITENQGISWAKTGSVTVDYFSTVLSASIVWRVTNHAGNFVKITFNDKVVYDEKRTVAKGSTLSGTVSVMGTFVNGGVNKITFDPDYNLFNNSQVT
ncbi:MAG: hypothetical protein FWE56_03485, partial [Candidatus Bathyarchaeota archaeon]|nr:hypothetical protein [Candidatus Termiticorpusculum sp.]